ncbi:MAG: polyphosphate kinase 1 [Candidatus Omnitrophota bacterium]|jgi:polyphosphate kinase
MNKVNESKRVFINRDLSWLYFNDRVLGEALDLSNPLLERLRFLSIAANNLDEFFMVRVSNLKRLIDAGHNHKDVFGCYPLELFSEIRLRADAQVEKLYAVYKEHISKDLYKNRISILKPAQLGGEQKRAVKRYFETTLFPILTPMAVDPGHPFPVLHSETNAFALRVNRKDVEYLALLVIPKSVLRLYRLPSETDEFCFIFIDEIIRENLEVFFRGYQIVDSLAFRIIRDSEIVFQEEYAPDLLKAIEGELKKRPKAKVISLHVEKGAHADLLGLLQVNLDFPKADIIFVDGNLDLSSLSELTSQMVRPELTFPSFAPAKMEYENIFDKIKEGDFLLHMPYQLFYPTVDLIQAAAHDKDVLAIKMTLYRTNEDSAIIKALAEAAKNKKQVTVLVELKARFDEERNIQWTRDLEAAGCHVIYGMPGIKIHSKMTLIVRQEEGRISRYVHLSTGNYNERTAGLYTDIGYFTKSEDFAMDISDVFNVITGYSLPARWRKIISSPNDMRKYFFELINKEIEFHKKYKNGFIFAKMNSLEDSQIIQKLYEASNADVKIRLLVRGICCLVPGVEGMSENIEVRSIVGRFLEHSRIYVFNNNSSKKVFLSSSDWMSRNFDRRVELLFEVSRQDLKDHLGYILEEYWTDNAKTHILTASSEYIRPVTEGKSFNAQEHLMGYYAG